MLEKVEILKYGKPATMAQGKHPKNTSRTGMAQAMLSAWEAYVKQYAHEDGVDKAVIVFLFDQDLIGCVYFEELQWMQVNKCPRFMSFYENCGLDPRRQ
jgi:hypothetical protein